MSPNLFYCFKQNHVDLLLQTQKDDNFFLQEYPKLY